jgi:murein tripeptide amidase MpaA
LETIGLEIGVLALSVESPSLDATRFYRFDEMTDLLQKYAGAYPKLADLSSAGKSYEGRDIWVLTITNTETGAADSKPAMYIDGNIHAGEVTGCNVCLYTIDYLLANYGDDDQVTTLLDTTTFYILPRVQPDGAEKYLTTPYTLRSSVRHWPTQEEDHGLYEEDIDGNGLILQMRVEDPNGEWKISDRDPRLMIKREPDDLTGTFYRLYVEGMLRDPRPEPLRFAATPYGIDQNRNWPANWSPWQKGGGAYPLSESETASVAQFIEDHPNISIVQNYHTTGGVILRAPCAEGDSSIPKADVEIYKAMGQIGEKLTGYPCTPVYDAFPLTDDQGRRATSGGFIEWTYGHKGILSFATELWDIKSRAGIARSSDDAMRVVNEETEEDGLKLLEWNDRELGERGFVPWNLFDHPQLGQVEIGGWNTKEVRQNAPPEFLEDECKRNLQFSLSQAAMLPKLGIKSCDTESLGDDLHIIRLTLENSGFLPTEGSALSSRLQLPPITVRVEGADILIGRPKIELGQLQGRASAIVGRNRPGQFRAENERLVEILVRGTGAVTITAESDRAGTVSQTVSLA